MKVGFFQFYPKLKDVEYNFTKIKDTLEGLNADLIVLPELALSGYNFLSKNELKPVAERCMNLSDEFKNLAKRKNMLIIVGFPETCENKIYNSAFAFLPNGEIKIYRKLHLFYYEKELFEPGNKDLFVFEYNGVRIGMMICFDWFFPEVTRILALKGADIIVHLTNLVLPYAQRVMPIRALENRVYVILANRFGEEKNGDRVFKFTGKSIIADIDGEILANAGEEEETIKIVEIDPLKARNKQINKYNNLFKDRRVEFYKEICIQR